ncbi:hypothetical protein A2U01_0085902, partial [Trifolium medium]|nr:hypothetical protein [Trifolium medium]
FYTCSVCDEGRCSYKGRGGKAELLKPHLPRPSPRVRARLRRLLLFISGPGWKPSLILKFLRRSSYFLLALGTGRFL